MGRSQLNAASTQTRPTGSTASGAAAMAPQPPPTPEPGETQTLSFDLLHFLLQNLFFTVSLSSSPPISAGNPPSLLCVLQCLHDNHRHSVSSPSFQTISTRGR